MSLISKDTLLHNVADAYRTASGTTGTVKAGELAEKISELSSGGGDTLESVSGNFAIKKATVTVGANNVATVTELAQYLLSLADTSYAENSYIYIELHPKISYVHDEIGCGGIAPLTPTRRYRNGWANISFNYSYNAAAIEGSVYDIFYIERYTAPF